MTGIARNSHINVTLSSKIGVCDIIRACLRAVVSANPSAVYFFHTVQYSPLRPRSKTERTVLCKYDSGRICL